MNSRDSLFEKLDSIQDQINDLECALDGVKDLIHKITLTPEDVCYHRSHGRKSFEYTTIGGDNMQLVKCVGCGATLFHAKKSA